MSYDVRIEGAEKLRRMARQLREADRTGLQRELNRAVRRAAEPTVRDIQKSAREIVTKGIRTSANRSGRHVHALDNGMRRQISNAVNFQIRLKPDSAIVSFKVQKSKLPDSLKNMPRI